MLWAWVCCCFVKFCRAGSVNWHEERVAEAQPGMMAEQGVVRVLGCTQDVYKVHVPATGTRRAHKRSAVQKIKPARP
jgi:hypothetical protein